MPRTVHVNIHELFQASPVVRLADSGKNCLKHGSLQGRIALVTGASAGIGLAIAKTLAQKGVTVIACARNTDTLLALNRDGEIPKGTKIHVIKTDLTKEQEVLALYKEIAAQHGKLDILINNAGMGGKGTLLDGDFEEWKNLVDLNILALTLSTREAVKLIDGKSTNGHIINVNSIVGHRVPNMPSAHFYTGTKHMVTALTEGLRKTLQSKNIRVTSVSPGAVETEFAERALGKDPEASAMVKAYFAKAKALEAQDIADAVVYALSVPAHVNIDELTITPTQQVTL
ncbi:Dehydrogenase/reductase SDR family member 11 [Hypsibius exemplaris]|uniref:Dehydrogenase/reductase SDR family member 11 n=1 Tax=Hypsibius exemplaris TaxID=2072580 RepID=A0A9X6RMB7_HYPEX|nr:Dehydrogenase/reductase SDR family member 11 [Hypsibius exemplaris]